MNLEQAFTYLTPHQHTNGPVLLTAPKMREAISIIQERLKYLEMIYDMRDNDLHNCRMREMAR
jgi:hypothetical protein